MILSNCLMEKPLSSCLEIPKLCQPRLARRQTDIIPIISESFQLPGFVCLTAGFFSFIVPPVLSFLLNFLAIAAVSVKLVFELDATEEATLSVSQGSYQGCPHCRAAHLAYYPVGLPHLSPSSGPPIVPRKTIPQQNAVTTVSELSG